MESIRRKLGDIKLPRIEDNTWKRPLQDGDEREAKCMKQDHHVSEFAVRSHNENRMLQALELHPLALEKLRRLGPTYGDLIAKGTNDSGHLSKEEEAVLAQERYLQRMYRGDTPYFLND